MNDADAAQIAKAMSHTVRIEVVRALRDQGVLSPTGFAGESGETLGNVSYHFKALLAAEVVAVVETVPRRGAMEHFYSLSGRRAGAALKVLELLAGP